MGPTMGSETPPPPTPGLRWCANADRCGGEADPDGPHPTLCDLCEIARLCAALETNRDEHYRREEKVIAELAEARAALETAERDAVNWAFDRLHEGRSGSWVLEAIDRGDHRKGADDGE